MKLSALLLLCAATPGALGFSRGSRAARRAWRLAAEKDEALSLEDAANRFEIEVFDMDEGVFGLSCLDPAYGIEVVRTTVRRRPSLGITLSEMVSESNPSKATALGGARSAPRSKIISVQRAKW